MQIDLNRMLLIANQQIKKLSFSESLKYISKDNSFIIDVREESELKVNGRIKNSIHIPRGVIEFSLNPDIEDNPYNIKKDSTLLLYCAGGYRSALAAKTLKDIGYENVFNIGGFGEWIDNGGPIQKK
tara:strand:+ start:1278 stop:1658 length:381 start_codon:yes stop_codon:yes gene_type:complete